MSQLHIRAEPGDVAPTVLLPGDPGRAEYIATAFFDEPTQYTSYRQLLGYTGRYRGMPVSVQTTGMGCPSLAIVVEELIRLGARRFVRVGTCGATDPGVAPGDLVVATASVANDGTTRHYLAGAPHASVADYRLVDALVTAGTAAGFAPHVGLIQTEDGFYATTPDDVPALAARGVLGIEMESSALFLLGSLRGVETATALVASNRIGDPTFVEPEVLAAAVARMTRMTLDALVALHAADDAEPSSSAGASGGPAS